MVTLSQKRGKKKDASTVSLREPCWRLNVLNQYTLKLLLDSLSTHTYNRTPVTSVSAQPVQHFTTEQTIAFRGIALSVFETDVVNGKLSLGEAFEAFTHQVLALAGAEDTGTNTTAATIKTANCSSDPLPCGDVASASKSEQTIGGGGSGDRASATGDGGGSTRVEDGDSSGSVFSVGDVDAITRFVARGLYRNFTLYRMCFQHEEKCCREMRQVQVETPLDLPPLNEAAEPDV